MINLLIELLAIPFDWTRYLTHATDMCTLKQKIYISAQGGLRWLHRRAGMGIAHQDLDEGNIIVLPKEEQVVFVDFGMAALGKQVLLSYVGGLRKERRRHVDPIKGWGRESTEGDL